MNYMEVFDDSGNGSANEVSCLVKKFNRTALSSVYEGIPETLLLNSIVWVFLVLLFTMLRQQAWDYGRLALVNSQRQSWTQVFFAQSGLEGASRTQTLNMAGSDRGFHLGWILTTLRLTNDQILAHSGPDALHYLSFQRHLMLVLLITTFISLVVVLPVNIQGTQFANTTTFGHTTIVNLTNDSPLLWVHVFVSILLAPLIVLIMRRSSGRNAGKTAPTRTLMVTNVGKSDCNKATIKEYFNQLYPDFEVEDVQLAYNITRLSEVVDEYKCVVRARTFCEMNRNRKAIKARPNFFSCKCVEALPYYTEKEVELGAQVARLKSSALNEPLGIAFITLSNTQATQVVIQTFKPGSYRPWAMAFAPTPSDIYWENLTTNSTGWYIRWVVVNMILFIFLFFLTTPLLIVQGLNTLKVLDKVSTITSPLVSEFLPTLLLWTLSVIMPTIVGYSERFLDHWTKSRMNYAILTKSFGYLLFMILILPSLGLTSAQALLEWSIAHAEDEKYRWSCIFLPDKGAFFVNYVITTAFIGTASELLRFSELIYYAWQVLLAKSRAEIPYIRESILTEFPFGVHYAWQLIIFTMSMVYSVACPLIMPFALLYICLKYVSDKYNLFFAYGPSNSVSQGVKIHFTAVTLTKFSIVILLINMAGLMWVRNPGMDARVLVLLASLFITMSLFTFMSPIKRCTGKAPRIRDDYSTTPPLYVASVLLDSRIIAEAAMESQRAAASASGGGAGGYGTDSTAESLAVDGDESPVTLRNEI